jgi:Fe-Mn family superoxide dismutase
MLSLTRRQALRSLGLGAAGVFLGQKAFGQAAQPPAGPFRLAPLPYANDALAPHIDARTMEIHHDRHHQAYVNNLNTAIAGNAALSAMTIDQIVRGVNNNSVVPMAIRAAVTNNGGGHWNHTFFWSIMGPNAGGDPRGPLAEAINATFTSIAQFKAAFKQASLNRFGSGWGWLVKNAAGRLEIVSTANQENPLMTGQTPLLGCDVWEHAYYLNYQNNRGGYIDAWWNVVNWTAVAQRFSAA